MLRITSDWGRDVDSFIRVIPIIPNGVEFFVGLLNDRFLRARDFQVRLR